MKYLEMFVELADRSEQLPEQQKACTCLGAIYNSLVRHQKAKPSVVCADLNCQIATYTLDKVFSL